MYEDPGKLNLPPKEDSQPSPVVDIPKQPIISNFLLIPMAVLVLILLASTGYLAFQNYQLRKEISQLQSSPSPTPSPDPTATWKTYTNREFGFTFKYPLDWDTLELGQNQETLMVAPKLQVDKIRDKPGGFGGGSFLTFTINKYTQNPAIKPDEFQEVSQEDLLLGNEPAIKYNILITQDEPGFSKGSELVSIVAKHEGMFLKLDLLDQQYSDTFDQILSTFKFLETTSPTP